MEILPASEAASMEVTAPLAMNEAQDTDNRGIIWKGNLNNI